MLMRNTKMKQQIIPRMSNQEIRVGAANSDQMAVAIEVRGTPAQIRQLFVGSSPAISSQPTGVQVVEIESGAKVEDQVVEIESGAKDEEKCKQAKRCCGGGCSKIFSPFVKIAVFISGVLSCCS